MRASVIRQDVYQSMADSAELAEIARRLYRNLAEVSRQNAARVVNAARHEVNIRRENGRAKYACARMLHSYLTWEGVSRYASDKAWCHRTMTAS